MPPEYDEWDSEELLPDNRPVCHLCGKQISGNTVYQYFGDFYHEECLHEVLEAQAEDTIASIMRDACTDAVWI